MARLDELFEMYRPVTKEKLWENLKYFLEKLMPVCHECDIKMAIHMDDPPWDIFGLPRLLVDAQMALSVAHRGYVMETGKIVATGSGAELIESPEIKRAYLGG